MRARLSARRLALGLSAGLSLLLGPPLARPQAGLAEASCPLASNTEALAGGQPDGQPLLLPTGLAHSPADYRARLATTALGWPRLDRWCVWVEPASGQPGAAPWEERWQRAVQAALERWRQLVQLEIVNDPAAAQVQIRRRRPPLRAGADGRLRASHGRAILQLRRVQRGGSWRREPAVEVLLSPGQRSEAMEATALHELGHAFGLWGHSDDPGDAMAAVPGAQPVRQFSPRDRATVLWLYGQPSPFGRP